MATGTVSSKFAELEKKLKIELCRAGFKAFAANGILKNSPDVEKAFDMGFWVGARAVAKLLLEEIDD